MNIFALCGFIIVAALISLTLRDYKKEYAVLIGLAVCIFAVLTALPDILKLFRFISDTANSVSGMGGKLEPLSKALGIAFVTEIASNLCIDTGERSMAGKIELLGKVSILIVSLPLAQQVLDVIKGLL